MDELFFVGMDIAEETKTLVDLTNVVCTDGMTENELKAYNLGIKNTISALKAVMSTDCTNEYVLNISGLDVATEISIDDLEFYLLDN